MSRRSRDIFGVESVVTMSRYSALLEECCCNEQPHCQQPCVYVAMDGVWTFIPNSPDPECEGDCKCFPPDIEIECDGQVAGCVCAGVSVSDDPDAPNCNYTVCGSESFPS